MTFAHDEAIVGVKQKIYAMTSAYLEVHTNLCKKNDEN